MSIYEQHAANIYDEKRRKLTEEYEQRTALRETLLSTVEKITGQSREKWPEPEWVENMGQGMEYWSVIVDGEIEFRQRKIGTFLARLQPSICSEGCRADIRTPRDLEGLVRRHLDCGAKHWPRSATKKGANI